MKIGPTFSIVSPFYNVENFTCDFHSGFDRDYRIYSCDSTNMSAIDKAAGELHDAINGKKENYTENVRIETYHATLYNAYCAWFDRMKYEYTAIMH